MSRELVNYETGVTAPDGYRETMNEYIYDCDSCRKQTEIAEYEGRDLCEECYIRESTRTQRLIDLLTDTAQLLDGWHNDGTCWSEWDESVRKRVSELLKELYEAKGELRSSCQK